MFKDKKQREGTKHYRNFTKVQQIMKNLRVFVNANKLDVRARLQKEEAENLTDFEGLGGTGGSQECQRASREVEYQTGYAAADQIGHSRSFFHNGNLFYDMVTMFHRTENGRFSLRKAKQIA